MLKINYFNMIEVALAMAIIAFGMTSILGLFPVGLNAARASIAENSGSDAAEQLAAYLKSASEYSTVSFNNSFVTAGGTILDHGGLPADAVLDTYSNDFLDAVKTQNFTNFPRIGEWQLYRTGANSSVFFVLQGPEGETSYDFAAMIKIWKTPVTCRFMNDNVAVTNTDDGYNYSGGINLEISWPIEKKYIEREKKYFYIEANKP
jgi:type II secretory pathway pseudopilin PulG